MLWIIGKNLFRERRSTMKKRARVLATALLTVVLVLAIAVGVSATTGTKSISAIFRNIQIIANGKFVATEAEPFIVNGRTYVPLRAISEALGAWVDWNSATNMVTIKGGTSSAEVEALKAQMAQKDAEIANLRAQLDNKTSGGDLDQLEKDLLDDYDVLGKVEIDDIKLSGDEDKVTVTIEVDLDDYGDEWEDLSDSKIKTWLSNICGDIQDEFDDDTYVSGKIKDIDSGDTLVTFTKNGTKSLSVSFKDDDYRGGGSGDSSISDVEKALDGETYKVGSIKFEITKIDYKTSSDIIEVELTAQDPDADDEWDDMDEDDIEDYVIDICEDIVEEFEDEAGADPETVKIYFYDEDDASLGDFVYDVAKGRLK